MKRIQVLYLALASVYVTLATGLIRNSEVVDFGGCLTDYFGFPLTWIIHRYCWGWGASLTLWTYVFGFLIILFGFVMDTLFYMAIGYGLLRLPPLLDRLL